MESYAGDGLGQVVVAENDGEVLSVSGKQITVQR
jgi:hypothetical protein